MVHTYHKYPKERENTETETEESGWRGDDREAQAYERSKLF